MPIAKKLAERVIQNSTDKLRPYLRQAIKSLGTSLDDYSEVVASVCQQNTDTNGHSKENILKDQLTANDGREETNFHDGDSSATRLSKSVVSIKGTGAQEIMTNANSSKNADSNLQLDAKSMFKIEYDDWGAKKPENSKAKLEHVEAQQVQVNHGVPDRDVHISRAVFEHVEAVKSFDEVENSTVQSFPSTAPESEDAIVASPTQSGGHPDESLSEMDILEKENLVSEETFSVVTASKKASGGESILEAKERHSRKQQTDGSIAKDKTLAEEVA